MVTLLPEVVEDYVHAHTHPEGEHLLRLEAETRQTLQAPQMQVGRVVGQFLRMIVQISAARRIIEVGTYSGYSSMAMASALPEDGLLISLDIDPVAPAVARRFHDEQPWARNVDIRIAPALETLDELAAEGAKFDLAFIDADKENYIAYWDRLVPMIQSGGLLLADNALWSGAVVNPDTPNAQALARFNDHVHGDDRVEHVLLSIRDGLMMARKR